MTRDDIIRVMREVLGPESEGWSVNEAMLEEWLPFLQAVAADEREACARMAEAFHQHGYDFTGDLELHEAIRARGQA